MYTVSWQPGTIKSYTVQQTWEIIIRGLQLWQLVSRVRFATGSGQANIRIYFLPSLPGNAAAGAYVQTGQIVISMSQYADRDTWAMAVAHEVGHLFGWNHTESPESIMYRGGSSVKYFDPNEGRRAWQQFGKYVGKHTPFSLTWLKRKIGTQKKIWNDLRIKRDAEKDPAKRAALDKQTKAANAVLVTLNNQYLRIEKAWKNVGGITLDSSPPQEQYLCMGTGQPGVLNFTDLPEQQVDLFSWTFPKPL